VLRVFLLSAALLLVGRPSAAPNSANLIAGVFEPARLAPDFSLRGSDGADLKLSRYRGKTVLLAFGYTSCTEVCPITLSVLARARKSLGLAAGELQVVYVTVDPKRDTVERMHTYLSAFDPSFLGGTGTAAELATVRANYGITVSKEMPFTGGYALSHSSYTYLIDRHGALRALMPYGHSAEDFVHDLRLLMAQ